MRKAFRVKAIGMTSITSAENRGQAKANVFRSANEVGYGVTFGEIIAHRAPEYDKWAAQEKRNNICFTEEHAKRLSAEIKI